MPLRKTRTCEPCGSIEIACAPANGSGSTTPTLRDAVSLLGFRSSTPVAGMNADEASTDPPGASTVTVMLKLALLNGPPVTVVVKALLFIPGGLHVRLHETKVVP